MKHVMKKNRKRKFSRISNPSASEDGSFSLDEGLKHHKSKKAKALKISEDESVCLSPKATKLGKPNKSHTDGKEIRRLEMLEANKEEVKVINRLENLLGVNKRRRKEKQKKIPPSFIDDGLDYILEVLDSGIEKESGLNNQPELSGSRSIISFPDERRKHSMQKIKNTHESEEDDELHDSSSHCSFAEESEISNNNTEDEASYDDQEFQATRRVNMDEKDSEASVSDEDVKKSKIKNKKPKIWEDIYGRLRDEEGNVLPNRTPVSQVYVPPHERVKQDPTDEKRKTSIGQIKRQLKGLINRLSESNMNRIGSEVEEMYMKNSRNDVNETLMSILTEVLMSPVCVPSRFAIEQAMFIALLHGNIGSEIGAFFLQSLALKLDEFMKNKRNCELGKECHNLLTFLCHLYNFKVTHSLLIFDILRLLVESFQEMDIELILLVLKHAGFALRKDDPSSFKEVLQSIQSKAAALKTGQNQSRVKFMLDILIEMRNNNMEKMKKLLNHDPSISEYLKKVLRGLVHKGSYIQELSISYNDLLKAQEQGRWWIVGSAWSERESENLLDLRNNTSSVDDSAISSSDKFRHLTKMLHINTETRKIVFTVIMTSQNYMDAFENLLRLELKNQQDKEIISVLLHCSLQEKNFNPYYAWLASTFCKYDRRFRGYFKFILWEKFKELGSMKSSQRNCLVSLLVHLLSTESLDISVLKVIQFSDMNKTRIQFFRKILTNILLHEEEEVCRQVFQRAATNDRLHLLRESLRLFMRHFILHRMSEIDHCRAEKLSERIKIAEDALNSAKHAFKL